MTRSKTGGAELARIQRDERVYELRLKGLTIREIASEIGCGSTTVARAVQRISTEARARRDEAKEALVQIEVDRIDAMQRGAWDRAVGKDPSLVLDDGGFDWRAQDGAIHSVHKLSERRAKLLGMDAPATTHNLNVTPDDVRQLASDTVGGQLDGLLVKLEQWPAAQAVVLDYFAGDEVVVVEKGGDDE